MGSNRFLNVELRKTGTIHPDFLINHEEHGAGSLLTTDVH
jgi:hypothetical protein